MLESFSDQSSKASSHPPVTPFERLVVVYNPHSAQAARVGRQVIDRLVQQDASPTLLTTVSEKFDDNVDFIAGQLRDGDRVIAAAGDGTSSQVYSSIIRSETSGVTLGFTGYGNLNDMAATYSGSETPIDPMRLVNSRNVLTTKPIDVRINDEHWRYSPAYTTVGWTAFAAQEFMLPHVRSSLKEQHKHLVSAKSFAHILAEYYRRRQHMSLPTYWIDDERELQTRSTDIVALNQKRMGRIIRHQAARSDSGVFLSKHLDVSSLTPNAAFFAKAFAGRMPGDVVSSQTVHFATPASFDIQSEGEGALLRDVQTLTFTKDHDVTVPIVSVES